MNNINELTEADYNEFFEWILDREVKLDKSLDITLCSTFDEPYVYYPEEIAKFLQTKPMQRLKRVEQLGSNLLINSDVSHTRYSHCLGTYNNAVLFYMMQYQNPNWKKGIEINGRKIEVLANIMEALRHDDGHNILSHGLENLIGKEKGAHEILGARFKKEYPETINALNEIHPELLENMEKVSRRDYDLLTQREGNLDFDRLDFLARDLFYLGRPEKKDITYELIKRSKIMNVHENADDKEFVVYDYDALPYIEEFIENRAEFYKKIVSSNERKSLDILEQQFCTMFLESDIPEGKELRDYLEHCRDSNANNMDLDQFLKWNDLKYYNQLVQIAMGDGNEAVRKLATACLPNIEGLCSLAIEALDPKNTNPKSYTLDDLEFLKNIKLILKKDHPLHSKLVKGTTHDSLIILNSSCNEQVNEVLQNLRSQGLSEQELDAVITWNEKIKKYNFDEPIYVKDSNGEIFTLDNHPDLSIDLEPVYISGALLLPAKLRENGISEDRIQLMKNEFEKFNSVHPKENLHQTRRMRKFQIGNDPYIPEYKPYEGENR